MSWSSGDIVVWRESWRGQTYFSIPTRIVEDSDGQLVFFVAEGTRFSFPPGGWPFAADHPWAHDPIWTGHGLLVRYRPGDAHTTWHFWNGENRTFAGWYVNMQEPLRRDQRSFETQDQELDIWIRPDGSWEWKDEQELLDWVPRGRFTQDEVVAIRAEGERVVAEWPFPTGWEDWEPEPAWPVPELPNHA